MSGLLLDTCVLIDCLRDRPAAVAFLQRLQAQPSVSVVTVAELHAGARNSREEQSVEDLLGSLRVLLIDLAIARLAGRFRRGYQRSHGVQMPDALIAATAENHGVRLVTRNVRHFPMLDDVVVPYH